MAAAPLLVAIAVVVLQVVQGGDALSMDYYDDKCPEAEAAVTAAVRQAMAKDRTVPAGLLRMHFHDCFVRVCMPPIDLFLHSLLHA
jgi:peroxidase